VSAAQTNMWLVTNFGAWLSNHASLVRSITLTGLAHNIPVTAVSACQTLAMALQSAATGPRPLRLLSFSCDAASPHRPTAPLLRVLPDCLTKLEVGATECLPNSAAEAAAGADSHVLARLTRLRHLTIRPGHNKTAVRAAADFLEPRALTPLTALTHLALVTACTQVGLRQRLRPVPSICVCMHPALQALDWHSLLLRWVHAAAASAPTRVNALAQLSPTAGGPVAV
jgi:hypothetical protein